MNNLIREALAHGERVLARPLSYSWRNNVIERSVAANTMCYAPGPDGIAYYCEITFDPRRMQPLSREDKIVTVLHELAHVADFAENPDRDLPPHGPPWVAMSHGPAWAAIMAEFAADPSLTAWASQ